MRYSNADARVKRDLFLFMLTGAFLGLYSGLYDPSFNNYLNDVFHISEVARGGLEFPRELPGFLVVFAAGLLIFLPDIRIAVVANLVLALGLFGQGFLSPNLNMVVIWMIAWSFGSHLYMPLESAIGMTLSKPGEAGKTLGQLGAIRTAVSLLGFLIVYFGFRYFHLNYKIVFAMAGASAIMAAVCLMLMTPRPSTTKRKRLLFKRKYMLFYWLNVLFGARKQVFLTFGPWVLIKIFDQPVTTFALLGLVGTITGIAFRALLGRAIDKFGERKIITWESIALIFVCLGYAFAEDIGIGSMAVWLIFACYVGDQLLFACNMARATYLNKIADSQDDLTPTLSMGVTVDHLASMTVPVFGGLIWMKFGYEYVFITAALIALINLFAAQKINTDHSADLKTQVGA